MHEKRLQIRWRDLDAYGHVNNAVYLNYLEEARDEWLERVLGPGAELWDFVLARVAIDYRRELTQVDREVVVTCGLKDLGRSSVRTSERIHTAAGALSAEAEAVLVPREPKTGRSRPLTADERSMLQQETSASG